MGQVAEPKLTAEGWDDLRGAYEAGSPVSRLSKTYGVSRQTIMRKAAKGGWDKAGQIHVQLHEGDARAIAMPAVPIRRPPSRGHLKAARNSFRRHRREWDHVAEIKTLLGKALDPSWAPAGMRPAIFRSAKGCASSLRSPRQPTRPRAPSW